MLCCLGVALYLSDVIVSLFLLEYDPGNQQQLKKKNVCGFRTGVNVMFALRTAE